jgi:glycosyltransferase involved in cell wall biosynthesis
VEHACRAGGTPLISCIVPAFNAERYLAEALDSILQQTYRRTEIVVVDDGSTDRSPDVIASFGPRLRAVRQVNSGPAAARNRGVDEARGEFIAFLDADDRWHPDKLRRQLAHFAERPGLDVSVTHCRNFWIPELAEEAERFRDHRIAQPAPAYLASTMLARRSVFERVGPFDTTLRFGHSTQWLLRCRECGMVFEALPDVLYERRIHYLNRTRTMGEASREEFLRLVKAHRDRQRESSGGRSDAAPERRRHTRS